VRKLKEGLPERKSQNAASKLQLGYILGGEDFDERTETIHRGGEGLI
jgi:hypothetical protein